jgi:hypothetical protein
MSESKKMQQLEELFTDAEAAKNDFGVECQRVHEILEKLMEMVKMNTEAGLGPALANLKTFLESANSTMKSIEDEIREIVNECMNIQSSLMSVY